MRGVLTIRRQRSTLDVFNRHYRSHPPQDGFAFRVGEALEAVVQDGDLLRATRHATTDLSVSLFRGDDLLVGLGAVNSRQLGPGMTFEEDPRIHEAMLYHLPNTLADPDTTLAWLDAEDPGIDDRIRGLRDLPGKRIVIAIAGKNPEQRRIVNNKAATPARFGLSPRSACLVTWTYRQHSLRAKRGWPTCTNCHQLFQATSTFVSSWKVTHSMFSRVSVHSTIPGICTSKRSVATAFPANSVRLASPESTRR